MSSQQLDILEKEMEELREQILDIDNAMQQFNQYEDEDGNLPVFYLKKAYVLEDEKEELLAELRQLEREYSDIEGEMQERYYQSLDRDRI